MSKKKTIEVEEMNIILRIPKDAAALTVEAALLKGKKVQKLQRELKAEDIRSARQAFLENVDGGDDYDARFVLSEEGLKNA